MTTKKIKITKKAKANVARLLPTILAGVALYVYTSFIWLMIAGGTAIAIVNFFFVDGTMSAKLMTSLIFLAIALVGLLLARLLDKNILNTFPTITF